MRHVTPVVQILSASAADVEQSSGIYFPIEGADEVLFDIQITGTLTASLDFDIHGDASSLVQRDFTETGLYIETCPMGRVRAWTNGCGGGESVTIKMRSVYFDIQRRI